MASSRFRTKTQKTTPRFTVNEENLTQTFAAYISTRMELMKRFMDGPNRDLDKDLGYPENPTIEDYKAYIAREGIADRANRVYPEECFSLDPLVYETEGKTKTAMEKRLDEINESDGGEESTNLWHYCQRVDEDSGVGRYGGLLIGASGGGADLARPLSGINAKTGEWTNPAPNRDLLFLRSFDESLVTISTVEQDPNSRRFGRPTKYLVQFSDAATDTQHYVTQEVHWTRFLHVCERRKSNEWLAVPRLQPVFNRLMDCRKILGASAEMFWAGGFPGLSFETHPNIEDPEINKEDVRAQVYNYLNKLQRYLAVEGMTVKSLSPQIADPTNHLLTQLNVISMTLGVPLRIFMGSEAAHLASTQDIQTWNRRLSRRQNRYLTPMVIRPLINRLMGIGVIPRVKKYFVEWRDLNAMSDKDKADVSMKKAQAIMAYVSSGAETVMSPHFFYTMILGMSPAEAEAIVASATTTKTKDAWKKTAQPTPSNTLGKRPARNGLGGRPKVKTR